MDKTLFYLMYRKQIDRPYIKFSTLMKRLGYTTVPISFDQLFWSEQMDSPEYLILFIDSLSGKDFFTLEKVKRIKSALILRKMKLVLVTSFYSIISEFQKSPMKDSIYIFPLPQTFAELCAKIHGVYEKNEKDDYKWPGGRRAKIPMQD